MVETELRDVHGESKLDRAHLLQRRSSTVTEDVTIRYPRPVSIQSTTHHQGKGVQEDVHGPTAAQQ